jgi:hypothetical protein
VYTDAILSCEQPTGPGSGGSSPGQQIPEITEPEKTILFTQYNPSDIIQNVYAAYYGKIVNRERLSSFSRQLKHIFMCIL